MSVCTLTCPSFKQPLKTCTTYYVCVCVQVTFIDLIVYPLFETWSDLVYPEAQHILDNLSSTRQYWSARITNSPPPTSPTPTSSPTPTTTPTTPQSASLATPSIVDSDEDAISFTSSQTHVKEGCEIDEAATCHSAPTSSTLPPTAHIPPSIPASSPAAKDSRCACFAWILGY